MKSVPKQFLTVNGKKVVEYSFEKFNNHPRIDTIVIVVPDNWRQYAEGLLGRQANKAVLFAPSGISRQHSVLNGLRVLSEVAHNDDVVLIHDSARPLFPERIIDEGIEACRTFDSALPVIPSSDTIYQSHNQEIVSAILPREQLFRGQSPEFFTFGKFFDLHKDLSDDRIASIKGSCELAYSAGLSVKLIEGDESNFKLTTENDMKLLDMFLLHTTD